jgi:bisphosphoglycerate-dependent phosphoglycerate mutase
VLVSTSENAIRGLLMHLCGIPKERISEIEIPTGLPLVYDLRERRLRLLEGVPSDYNFGKGVDMLFTPHDAR